MIPGGVEDLNPNNKCTSDSWDSCSFNSGTSHGFSYNAHGFRVTAAPGSEIGIKVEFNHSDEFWNHNENHWNLDVTFYVDGVQVGYYPRIGIYGYNKYGDYDVVAYADQNSNTRTQTLRDEYGSSSTLNLTYTVPQNDDGIVDIVFGID